MHLQIVNDKRFGQMERYYVQEKGGKKEAHEFLTYVYNALHRYVQSGDFTHLNNIVTAARAGGRFRKTMRVIPSVAAHKFDKKEKEYGGRADSKKLQEMREPSEEGNVWKWQDVFYAALSDEDNHEKQPPEWSWDKKKKNLLKIVREAKEHGVDDSEINAALAEARREAQEADTPMPEVVTSTAQPA